MIQNRKNGANGARGAFHHRAEPARWAIAADPEAYFFWPENQQQRAKTRATRFNPTRRDRRTALPSLRLTRGSPSRRRFFLGSFSSSADSSPSSSLSLASSSSHSSMKSPPTKACEFRSENATWSGLYSHSHKNLAQKPRLPPKWIALARDHRIKGHGQMRVVYAGDTTNGGHPGEHPCAPRRQTHTHVYFAARRRLPRVHVRRGGLIIHSPWLRRARRKRHRRRLHPHAQVLMHHMLTNDAVSARRFKVYTKRRCRMRCGSSHTSYALPKQLHATASVASASIATAHKPAVGLGLRGVRINSKRRPVRCTEARRARGARLGALLLVLVRRSALLGLLRLPSGLIPPDGGTLRSRRWRHFCGFGSTLVHFFLVLDLHKLHFWFWIHTSSLLVLDPH